MRQDRTSPSANLRFTPEVVCAEVIAHYFSEGWGMINASRFAGDMATRLGQRVSVDDAIDMALEHRRVKCVAILPSASPYGCRMPHIVLDLAAMECAMNEVNKIKDKAE